MKLDGRRESENVDDRRRISGGTAAGMGIGGIIMAIAIAYFTNGGDLGSAISQGVGQAMQQSQNVETVDTEREFTEEEQNWRLSPLRSSPVPRMYGRRCSRAWARPIRLPRWCSSPVP